LGWRTVRDVLKARAQADCSLRSGGQFCSEVPNVESEPGERLASFEKVQAVRAAHPGCQEFGQLIADPKGGLFVHVEKCWQQAVSHKHTVAYGFVWGGAQPSNLCLSRNSAPPSHGMTTAARPHSPAAARQALPLMLTPCSRPDPSVATSFLCAQLSEQYLQRAKFRKAALQQIRSDKRGEPKPITAMEKWAPLHSKRQRDQNKQAGENAHETIGGHSKTPPDNCTGYTSWGSGSGFKSFADCSSRRQFAT
jgi:hypothetical protein